MYFGYERMWTLSFIPAGFAAVCAVSVALGCVYFVGAARGGRAAATYTRLCSVAGTIALAGTLAFGVVTGQWAIFMDWYGAGPLFEMGLLAFMWVVTMWLMAVSYSRGKMREECVADDRAGEPGEGD